MGVFRTLFQYAKTLATNVWYGRATSLTDSRYIPDAQPADDAFQIWFVIYARIFLSIVSSPLDGALQGYWEAILSRHSSWLRAFAERRFPESEETLNELVRLSQGRAGYAAELHRIWISVARLLAAEVRRRDDMVRGTHDITARELSHSDETPAALLAYANDAGCTHPVIRWTVYHLIRRVGRSTVVGYGLFTIESPPTLLSMLFDR